MVKGYRKSDNLYFLHETHQRNGRAQTNKIGETVTENDISEQEYRLSIRISHQVANKLKVDNNLFYFSLYYFMLRVYLAQPKKDENWWLLRSTKFE